MKDVENAAKKEVEDTISDVIRYEEIDNEESNYEAGRRDALYDFGKDLFIAGATWRINSVWHDATEKPKLGELIIVEVYGKIWEYGKSDVCDTNHPAARWAYMKDLIQNE